MVVKKFLCFQLTTTGLIIGWIGLVESILSIVSGILVLTNLDQYIHNNTNFPDTNPDKLRAAYIGIFATTIALNAIDAIASVMLIAGTTKSTRLRVVLYVYAVVRRHLYIIPWLINSFLSLMFGAIIVGIVFISLMVNGSAVVQTFIFAIISVFALSFSFYIWISIYSLYKVLRDSTENRSLLQNSDNVPAYTRIV